MNFVAGNAQHIGSRQQQQDSFGFFNLEPHSLCGHAGMLAVVADGMGGMAHGEVAGRLAVDTFLAAYQRKTESETIPESLLRSLHAANHAVFEKAVELDAAEEMGTTLIAAVIHDQRLHWISCGDSAIFLYRQGEFTLLNQPHVFGVELDDQVEQGTIPRNLAQAHPERDSLTSFLGLQNVFLIDRSLHSLALREDDVILLATDGLFKTLSFDAMTPSMQHDAQTMCTNLVKHTIGVKKPFQDNVTVIALTAGSRAPLSPSADRKQSKLAIILFVAGLLLVAAYIIFRLADSQSDRNSPRPQGELRKG